jgi:ribosomal protein S18 acetylase RimI-like enzyme
MKGEGKLMDIEVKPALDCGEGVRHKISRIFVESFYQYLSFFAKDKEKLAGAFAHAFTIEHLFAALIDGEIAGMAFCSDKTNMGNIIASRPGEMIKHLGLYKGIAASIVFKLEFEQISSDLSAATERTACIDFIATLPEYRGRGAASAIIKHICALPQYDEFLILDVADVNTGAIRLYESLGFVQFRRTEKHYSKSIGINAYLSFKKGK